MTEVPINQKEYLKKYLGIGKAPGEKRKRKKKHISASSVQIIDDDAEVNIPFVTIEDDPLNTNEYAPQIVAIIDERPPSLRVDDKTKNPLWRPIGTVESVNLNEQQQAVSSFKIPPKSPPRKKLSSSSPEKKQNSSLRNISIKEERKSEHRFNDSSPPRRSRKEDDYSPPRQIKQEVESPPEEGTEDNSPPRRRGNNEDSLPKRVEHDADNSPPRRRKAYSNTPPRRHNHASSGKHKKDSEKYRRNREETDRSPRRDQQVQDSSPRRNRQKNDSYTLRRHEKEQDSSPPRKKRNEIDNSPPRRNRRENSPVGSRRDDIGSHKRNRSIEESSSSRRRNISSTKHDSSSKTRTPDHSPLRRHRNQDDGRESKRSKRMEQTLDGKSAGLQNASELIEETENFRKREDNLFKNLSKEVSGQDAETVHRDRRSGKIRNVEEEEEKQRKKREEEERNKEKYERWGRGLAQVENREQKLQEQLQEMSKPLARYADDEDLERYLKEQEREGDPMLDYIRKKKRKKMADAGVELKPQFEGEFMPNRYGIRPGHRWDGVDRSNGYEKKWFEIQNEKKAVQEVSYKWSTEDM